MFKFICFTYLNYSLAGHRKRVYLKFYSIVDPASIQCIAERDEGIRSRQLILLRSRINIAMRLDLIWPQTYMFILVFCCILWSKTDFVYLHHRLQKKFYMLKWTFLIQVLTRKDSKINLFWFEFEPKYFCLEFICHLPLKIQFARKLSIESWLRQT